MYILSTLAVNIPALVAMVFWMHGENYRENTCRKWYNVPAVHHISELLFLVLQSSAVVANLRTEDNHWIAFVGDQNHSQAQQAWNRFGGAKFKAISFLQSLVQCL